MATMTAPPLDPTAARPARASKRPSLSRAGWATYVVAFALVGICIGPVLYIILGGFRTNAEITVDPSVPIPGFVLKRAMKGGLEAATEGLRKQVMKVKKG